MKKDKMLTVLSVVIIVLSVLIIAAGAIYLFSERMIPGLLPIAQALLMVLMIIQWNKQQQNGKLYAIIFAAAALLNLIAAILQIMNAK